MIISGRLRRESSTDKDFVILIDPISVCCIGKEIEIRDRSFRKYTKEFHAEAIAECRDIISDSKRDFEQAETTIRQIDEANK